MTLKFWKTRFLASTLVLTWVGAPLNHSLASAQTASIYCSNASASVLFEYLVHEGGTPPGPSDPYGKERLIIGGKEFVAPKFSIRRAAQRRLEVKKTALYRSVFLSVRMEITSLVSELKSSTQWMVCEERTYIGPPRP